MLQISYIQTDGAHLDGLWDGLFDECFGDIGGLQNFQMSGALESHCYYYAHPLWFTSGAKKMYNGIRPVLGSYARSAPSTEKMQNLASGAHPEQTRYGSRANFIQRNATTYMRTPFGAHPVHTSCITGLIR